MCRWALYIRDIWILVSTHEELGFAEALLVVSREGKKELTQLVKTSLSRHPFTIMTLFVNPMQVSRGSSMNMKDFSFHIKYTYHCE